MDRQRFADLVQRLNLKQPANGIARNVDEAIRQWKKGEAEGVVDTKLTVRNMIEQLDSQLPAADVVVDPATLDRIDRIVRPGVNLNPADTSYGEQVLQPALRRR